VLLYFTLLTGLTVCSCRWSALPRNSLPVLKACIKLAVHLTPHRRRHQEAMAGYFQQEVPRIPPRHTPLPLAPLIAQRAANKARPLAPPPSRPSSSPSRSADSPQAFRAPSSALQANRRDLVKIRSMVNGKKQIPWPGPRW
jgi:hypothetical protein